MKRVSCSARHTGKHFDRIKLAQVRGWERAMNRLPQCVLVDGAAKATGQTRGGLLEGHDGGAEISFLSQPDPALAHCKSAVHDQRSANNDQPITPKILSHDWTVLAS